MASQKKKKKTSKRGRGRPALPADQVKGAVVTVRLDSETAAAVECFRAELSAELAAELSRSAAIGALIKRALAARPKRRK